MDWEEFKDYVREHWKIFVGVAVGVIVAIVAISLILVFTLNKKDVSPTTSFKGPKNINGDVIKSGDTFGFPQIISNPNGNAGFGKNMFIHEAGYICVTSSSNFLGGTPILNFYMTNLSGNIVGPTNTFVLDFLPSAYSVVCNGTFAPIFNVANEVYYFFLSIGYQDQTTLNAYATNIIMYTLDTNPKSPNALTWVQSNITSIYSQKIGPVTTLKIPSSYVWDQNVPYYGTFGDKIQVVVDDNENVTKHSLYVNGSESSPNAPGGNLYWFVLSNNTSNPDITLIRVIQDAKLLLLKQQRESGQISCPVPTVNVPGDYINGFASDFFVSSGNGKDNVMVIANCTNQDYCALQNVDQPAAPKGYVQGFLPDATNGWIQPESARGSGYFLYRYIAALSDTGIPNNGFGYSVGFVNNHLIVGLATSPNTNPPKNAKFYVYNWVPQPFSNGSLTLLTTIDPATWSSAPFLQTDVYPISTITNRYNLFSQAINDDNQVLVTTWYNNLGNVISIVDPIVPNQAPYSVFIPIQNIGTDYSSQTSSLTIPMTRIGFAQNTNTWISRTGLTTRLAFNDPLYANGTILGRIIILSRLRKS
jgi:hypothetical protein